MHPKYANNSNRRHLRIEQKWECHVVYTHVVYRYVAGNRAFTFHYIYILFSDGKFMLLCTISSHIENIQYWIQFSDWSGRNLTANGPFSTYSSTYLLIYLHTHSFTYFLTYLPTSLFALLLIYFLHYLISYLLTYLLSDFLNCLLAYLLNCQLPSFLRCFLTSSLSSHPCFLPYLLSYLFYYVLTDLLTSALPCLLACLLL